MGFVWTDDDDDDDDAQGQQQQPPAEPPPALRKHLRKLERELTELRKAKADNDAKARVASVADAVKALGYDPKVADLIPSTVDGADAIRAWLDERSTLFAKITDTDDGEPSADDEMDAETVEGLARLQKVSGSALPAGKLKDAEARIKSANSKEELDEVLRSLGNKA